MGFEKYGYTELIMEKISKVLAFYILLPVLFFVFTEPCLSGVTAINRSTPEAVVSADRCAAISENISQLMVALGEIIKEINSLAIPSRSASESSEDYAQQLEEYLYKLKILEDKASEIERKTELKEKELEMCLQNSKRSSKSFERSTTEKIEQPILRPK